MESMGAISALRTGNVVFDMMIAMTIPVIFKMMFDLLANLSRMVAGGELTLSSVTSLWFPFHERAIEHKQMQNMFGESINSDRDTRNNVLIKAITLFLDNKKVPFKQARVNLVSMTQSERPWWCGDDDDERTPAGKLKKYRLSQKAPNYRWMPIGVYGGKKAQEDVPVGKEPMRLARGDGPPESVELRVEEHSEDKGEKAEKTVTKLVYRLRSKSSYAIDCFVDEAYQWYLAELGKMEDNSRYLYEMQVMSGSSSSNSEGDSNSGARMYKRYKLSDEKSFTSLFFEEKEMLLGLLKHFKNKTGKYGVAGYPHKLGLLLHGPPGTGKTSLIKAMAQHTGRSIINVPLARISTNQELMDIMFDQQYMVQGEEVPIKLGFKDVIFVMEDVDAASKIVHRRDGKTTSSVTHHEVVEATKPKSPFQLFLECEDGTVKELVTTLIGKSERLKKSALGSSALLCNATKKLGSIPGLGLLVGGEASADGNKQQKQEASQAIQEICDAQSAGERFIKQQAEFLKRMLDAGAEVDNALEDVLLAETAGTSAAGPPTLTRQTSAGYGGSSVAPIVEEKEESEQPDLALMMGTLASLMDKGGGADAAAAPPLLAPSVPSSKDKLNLSGLLNVLDGVVDTPARILIMTTNHPEQLDPALIRPGRVDKKILLGYMTPVHVISMIEHYFQTTLTGAQKDQVSLAITGSDETGVPALKMTPAQIEQLTAEHDEVSDMVVALALKGNPDAVSPVKDESATASTTPAGRKSKWGKVSIATKFLTYDN